MNTRKLTYEEFKAKHINKNIKEAIGDLVEFHGFTYDAAEFEIDSMIKEEYKLYLSDEYYPEP